MGAGSSPAGHGAAGADVAPDVAPPRNVTLPAAIAFDGASGDYLLDENGLYQALHPVSQRVVLKLLVKFGSIASSPTTGSKFNKIARGTPAQREAQAKQIVKDTLKDDIAAGDIKLERVDVDTSSPGATLTAIYFRNLREDPTGSSSPQLVTIKR